MTPDTSRGCCAILTFFTLCLLLALWGIQDYENVSSRTCTNDPLVDLADTRYVIEMDMLFVDAIIGNDTACIAASEKHTFKSIPACKTIDAALTIALKEPHIDWFISIRWGVYISNDPIVIPCNIDLIGDGDYAAVWITENGLTLANLETVESFCSVTFRNLNWESRGVSVFSTNGDVPLYLKFDNVTFTGSRRRSSPSIKTDDSSAGSNIVISASSARVSFSFTTATDAIWTMRDVQLIEMNYASWSNAILHLSQPRVLQLHNSNFDESALYLHNSEASFRIEAYGSVFYKTGVSIDNCYCAHLRTDDTAILDAINPSCTGNMHVELSIPRYVPKYPSHWETPSDMLYHSVDEGFCSAFI